MLTHCHFYQLKNNTHDTHSILYTNDILKLMNKAYNETFCTFVAIQVKEREGLQTLVDTKTLNLFQRRATIQS